MFDQLKVFLQDNATPELFDLYIESFTLLDAVTEGEAYDEVSLFLNTQEYSPTDIKLDAIYKILKVGLEKALSAYGIFLYTDKINTLKVFLETMSVVEDSEEHSVILNICHTADDEVMALLDLLEFATSNTWADFADEINMVQPQLIARIKEMHTVESSSMEDVEVDANRLRTVRAFAKAFPNSPVVDWIKSKVILLNQPFEMLVKEQYDYLISLSKGIGTSNALLAMEVILGLAIVSDQPIVDWSVMASDILDVVYDDADFIAACHIHAAPIGRKINQVMSGENHA